MLLLFRLPQLLLLLFRLWLSAWLLLLLLAPRPSGVSCVACTPPPPLSAA
jgi:hypothetical protein